MDYLGDLQEVIMDAVFSIYLSRSFDSLCKENVYYPCVDVLMSCKCVCNSL